MSRYPLSAFGVMADADDAEREIIYMYDIILESLTLYGKILYSVEFLES